MRRPRLGLPSIAAISLAVIVIVIVIDSGTALAQSAAAEALFADGDRLLKEGKIAEACDALEASNRLEPRAGTLVNLGLCRERNGQLASAWSAFKDAATRAIDPKKKKTATDRIAAIEPRMSYLTISVADESRVEGLAVTRDGKPVDAALWNRAIPVDGGSSQISGRAPGHEEWSTTVEIPPERGKVSVEVPRFKEIAKLVTPTIVPEPPAVDVPQEQDRGTTPGMFTGRRKIALGVAAVGVVAIGSGVVLGLQAKGLQDDAYALCPEPLVCSSADEATSLMERGRTRALMANIGFGVGAGLAVGAVVLWFVGAPTSSSSSSIAIQPRAGAVTGADVTFRF